MAEPTLIIPRRNFLVRALGFTAAGASLTVPIVTVDSAEKRLFHHLKGVESAMRELFPASHVEIKGNCLSTRGLALYQDRLSRGEREYAVAIATAGPHPGSLNA